MPAVDAFVRRRAEKLKRFRQEEIGRRGDCCSRVPWL